MKTKTSRGPVDRTFTADRRDFCESWGSEHANEALWTIQDSVVAELRQRDLVLFGIGMEGCLAYADGNAIAQEAAHPHRSAGRPTEVTARTGTEGTYFVDWSKAEQRERAGGNVLDETCRRFHAFRALRPRYGFREQWLQTIQNDDGLGSDGNPLCGPHGFSEELPAWLRNPPAEWCERPDATPTATVPETSEVPVPKLTRRQRASLGTARAGVTATAT